MTWAEKVEQVKALLQVGYAQKTVTRMTGVARKEVGKIAVQFQVGRRVGQTRAQVFAKRVTELSLLTAPNE